MTYFFTIAFFGQTKDPYISPLLPLYVNAFRPFLSAQFIYIVYRFLIIIEFVCLVTKLTELLPRSKRCNETVVVQKFPADRDALAAPVYYISE